MAHNAMDVEYAVDVSNGTTDDRRLCPFKIFK